MEHPEVPDPSRSAQAAAIRWGLEHPEQDVEHPPPRRHPRPTASSRTGTRPVPRPHRCAGRSFTPRISTTRAVAAEARCRR